MLPLPCKGNSVCGNVFVPADSFLNYEGIVVEIRGEIFVDDWVWEQNALQVNVTALAGDVTYWSIDWNVGYNSSLILGGVVAAADGYNAYVSVGDWLPFDLIVWTAVSTPVSTGVLFKGIDINTLPVSPSPLRLRVLSEVQTQATPGQPC